MKNIREIVSANLLALRKQRGLTQNELADRLGINRVSLSRILSNKNDIRVSTITKIADAIGCDVAEFFKPEEPANNHTITCPHCGEKLVINLSVSDKKHD